MALAHSKWLITFKAPRNDVRFFHVSISQLMTSKTIIKVKTSNTHLTDTAEFTIKLKVLCQYLTKIDFPLYNQLRTYLQQFSTL